MAYFVCARFREATTVCFFFSLSLSRCFLRVEERMGILVSFCADRETMGNKSSAPAASDIAADGVLLFRFRRGRGGGKLLK